MYKTLFTTLIPKRKTYLKCIQNQGIQVMDTLMIFSKHPTCPLLGVVADFLTRRSGCFPMHNTWGRVGGAWHGVCMVCTTHGCLGMGGLGAAGVFREIVFGFLLEWDKALGACGVW